MISDAVWLALIGVLVLVVKEYFDSRRAKIVASKVEEVREQAQFTAQEVRTASAEQHVRLLEVHILVNSAWGKQLSLYANVVREKANLTKDPADIRVAELAESAVVEHASKQQILDKFREAISFK